MDDRSKKALAALRKDSRLKPIIARIGPPRFHEYSRQDLLHNLLEAIVAQQLSGKVASVIFGRLKALGGPRFPNPSALLKLTDQQLKEAGLSRAKMACVRDLCTRISDGNLDLGSLPDLPDAEVEKALVQVRGIGPWTAHMALIFALGRPDVWPAGDLGLRNSLREVLGLDRLPTIQEAEAMGDPWRPWRSYACWYLWQIHDA